VFFCLFHEVQNLFQVSPRNKQESHLFSFVCLKENKLAGVILWPFFYRPQTSTRFVALFESSCIAVTGLCANLQPRRAESNVAAYLLQMLSA